MLFRADGEQVIAIAQPSHSWLSGQILRAWGNDRFAPPSPREEVCLGAELHDIGWLPWEAAPTLNPATGRPHDFREVDVRTHTELWTNGVRLAQAFGLYPALLISRHADTIYGAALSRGAKSPPDAALVRAFLEEQHALQRDLARRLSADVHVGADTTSEALERNRLLLGAADFMSLEIGWGVVEEEARIPRVPAGDGRMTELRMTSPGRDPGNLTVDPWPFTSERVELRCEGRRLRQRFTDEETMRQALNETEPLTLVTVLRPS